MDNIASAFLRPEIRAFAFWRPLVLLVVCGACGISQDTGSARSQDETTRHAADRTEPCPSEPFTFHGITANLATTVGLGDQEKPRYQEPGIRILTSLASRFEYSIFLMQECYYGESKRSDIEKIARIILHKSNSEPVYVAVEDTPVEVPANVSGLGAKPHGESGQAAPNCIVSSFPIEQYGRAALHRTSNRNLLWAVVTLPSNERLLVISAHFIAGDDTAKQIYRTKQARALASWLQDNAPTRLRPFPPFVLLGLDANTFVGGSKLRENLETHTALAPLKARFVISNSAFFLPRSRENIFTSNLPNPTAKTSDRNYVFDWLVGSPSLQEKGVAITISVSAGIQTFPHGFLFDTTEYNETELTRLFSNAQPYVPLFSDTNAPGMEHVAVVRRFAFP